MVGPGRQGDQGQDEIVLSEAGTEIRIGYRMRKVGALIQYIENVAPAVHKQVQQACRERDGEMSGDQNSVADSMSSMSSGLEMLPPGEVEE